jgi:hypothetical protein
VRKTGTLFTERARPNWFVGDQAKILKEFKPLVFDEIILIGADGHSLQSTER